MISRVAVLALMTGLFNVVAGAGPLSADTIRVAVASNFAPTLRVLQPDFESRSGHTLVLSAGSTGKHYAQILQGAPYAVFLAADEERPELLEREGAAVPGSRFTYALGRLALWAPDGGSNGTGLTPMDRLTAQPTPQLAIANPRLAPYGAAAEAFLRHEGLWDATQTRLVMGENVGQAFQFVATGAVPLGLVALAQVKTLERSTAEPAGDSLLVIDQGLYPPIRQQAVLLQDAAGARAFLAWLKSPEVRDRLADFGYDAPHAEP